MSYDEKLVERVRAVLADQGRVTEKPLMGTLAFLVNGAMCCSVGRDGLLVRVDAEARAKLLSQPFMQPMKLGARTMKGFVRVAPEGFRTRARLAHWIALGVAASVASKRKPSPQRETRSSTKRPREA